MVTINYRLGVFSTFAHPDLRDSGLEIYGAAHNAGAYQQVVEWVRSGALTVPVTVMPLSGIAPAWTRTDLRGRRLVIVPDRGGGVWRRLRVGTTARST